MFKFLNLILRKQNKQAISKQAKRSKQAKQSKRLLGSAW
jgi:hypothetical protein